MNSIAGQSEWSGFTIYLAGAIAITERSNFDKITDPIPNCVQTRLEEFLDGPGKHPVVSFDERGIDTDARIEVKTWRAAYPAWRSSPRLKI